MAASEVGWSGWKILEMWGGMAGGRFFAFSCGLFFARMAGL